MTAKKKPALSAASRRLVDKFSEAAMDWGWMRDQGAGGLVGASEDEFNLSKAALERRILALEKQASKSRKPPVDPLFA